MQQLICAGSPRQQVPGHLYQHTLTAPAAAAAAGAGAAAAAACSSSRPLYFHTDDSRLRSMFAALSKAGITPKPSILPDV
jgi:hypothetical protein